MEPLVSKLQAYGLSREACLLITSYFQRRRQCVKVVSVRSEWMTVRKGAPQGSVLGPFIFNLFQNDLIVKLERTSDVYN